MVIRLYCLSFAFSFLIFHVCILNFLDHTLFLPAFFLEVPTQSIKLSRPFDTTSNIVELLHHVDPRLGSSSFPPGLHHCYHVFFCYRTVYKMILSLNPCKGEEGGLLFP